MVEAAQRIACIFVDCNWGKKNKELTDAYGVKGYPTVVFCDPDAKPVDGLPGTDADSVARKMTEIADRYGSQAVVDVPKPKLEAMSYLAALAESRRQRKPLAVFFYDDTPASQTVTISLTDPAVQRVLKRFVLAVIPYKKDSADAIKFDVSRVPVILILDGTKAKPEEKPIATIAGSKSPRELVREFESAIPAVGDPEPSTKAGGPPAPREPEEQLSNDELEKKFIQARIGIAMETSRKGQKEKAIGILEDVIKSYPKHVETLVAKKLLEDLKK